MKPQGFLPGSVKKQAQAVCENVEWMAKEFGEETLGFLTLTAGDRVGGKFVKIHCPAEFQRRLNSLLTNVIRPRYRCGVVVIEAHRDGGLHAHLVCAVGADIRSGFDRGGYLALQEAVKQRKRKGWSAVECGANQALSGEWAHWRAVGPRYGFGRCNLQPVASNGAAVARYAAKYVTKGFEHRRAAHKGMRTVRYFGNWQTVESQALVEAASGRKSKAGKRFTALRGFNTPKARAWRECMKQIAFCSRGAITELTVAHAVGQRWASVLSRQMSATLFMVGESARWSESLRAAMAEHNEAVSAEWGSQARPVWERHASEFQREDFDSEVPVWLHEIRIENDRELCRSIRRSELSADIDLMEEHFERRGIL